MKRLSSFLVHALSVSTLLLMVACGGGGGGGGDEEANNDPGTNAPPPPTNACSSAGIGFAHASHHPTVCMLTTQGEIVVELYPLEAPATVANFLRYVNDGRYNNTLYHNAVKDSYIEGGRYTNGMQPIWTYGSIKLEAKNGLSNVRGTLAMNRDSKHRDSATSQFFFNLADNSRCYDAGSKGHNCSKEGYAVFGRVVRGMEVLTRISSNATGSRANEQSLMYWAQQVR